MIEVRAKIPMNQPVVYRIKDPFEETRISYGFRVNDTKRHVTDLPATNMFRDLEDHPKTCK